MGPIAYENGEKTVYKMQAPLSLECFRINKRTAQLTRGCSKCLDNEKMYKENRKCKHGRHKEICCECKGSRIVTTTNEDQPVMPLGENRFACAICNNQSVVLVVVVPFANIKRSGQSVEAVT